MLSQHLIERFFYAVTETCHIYQLTCQYNLFCSICVILLAFITGRPKCSIFFPLLSQHLIERFFYAVTETCHIYQLTCQYNLFCSICVILLAFITGRPKCSIFFFPLLSQHLIERFFYAVTETCHIYQLTCQYNLFCSICVIFLAFITGRPKCSIFFHCFLSI